MKILIIIIGLLPCISFAQEKNTYNSIVKKEFIFTPQSEHTHGSSIVALPNGDLLSCWLQGSGERKADDVRIIGARLAKGSKTWSMPFLMADTKDIPDCNPVLFLNAKGKLFLVWIAVMGNRWEGSILKTRTTATYDNSGAPVWEWQDTILLKPGEEFVEEIETKLKQLSPQHHGWAEYTPSYDKMIIEASNNEVHRSIGWMSRIKPAILKSGRIAPALFRWLQPVYLCHFR